MLTSIRALELEFNRPIGVLQDLQGPKIRIGRFDEGKFALDAGKTVCFALSERTGGSSQSFAAAYRGQALIIDDGRVRLVVEKRGSEQMMARVVIGGVIRDHKGVNLLGALLNISPLTKKDRADFAFGLKLGVEWVALSFVSETI